MLSIFYLTKKELSKIFFKNPDLKFLQLIYPEVNDMEKKDKKKFLLSKQSQHKVFSYGSYCLCSLEKKLH